MTVEPQRKRQPYEYHPDWGDAPYVAETYGYDPTHGTHGTTLHPDIGVGSTILPAAKSGVKEVHPGLTDRSRAYYSAGGDAPLSQSISASAWGWSWASMAADDRQQAQPWKQRPREVVHHVVPQGRVEGDKNINPSGHSGRALTADSLKVTDTEWIPPAKNPVGVQGTLPHVNWNQFTTNQVRTQAEDVNSLDLQYESRRMQKDRRQDQAIDKSLSKQPRSQLRGQQRLELT